MNPKTPIFESESLKILEKALLRMAEGFVHLPPLSDSPEEAGGLEDVLLEVARRLQDNCPYHHPLYAGQMLKPPHAVARLAYQLALWINPNNHALDGGRASSAMEKEAVAALAKVFGWKHHLGHLCGGGTMANLEALWVAGRLAPGQAIAASELAHYTHGRISELLGLDFVAIPADGKGRMDLDALEKQLKEGRISTVVATMGTTGLGTVDPLSELLAMRETRGFRIHADAAYGGYFTLAEGLSPEPSAAFAGLGEVDSLVIDPHKHGLQPYGCGCVLFRDPSVGRFYKHDSPYTYFSSAELHLGEISLECSRPGASAVALWATQRLFPMDRGGVFAAGLSRCHRAAMELYRRCEASDLFLPLLEPELDIVAFAPKADRIGEVSALSRSLFEAAAGEDLHLALFSYPSSRLPDSWKGIAVDEPTVTCLRSCLMKVEHLDWLDEIWRRLLRAHETVTASSSS